jgi:hypothetical protein
MCRICCCSDESCYICICCSDELFRVSLLQWRIVFYVSRLVAVTNRVWCVVSVAVTWVCLMCVIAWCIDELCVMCRISWCSYELCLMCVVPLGAVTSCFICAILVQRRVSCVPVSFSDQLFHGVVFGAVTSSMCVVSVQWQVASCV